MWQSEWNPIGDNKPGGCEWLGIGNVCDGEGARCDEGCKGAEGVSRGRDGEI